MDSHNEEKPSTPADRRANVKKERPFSENNERPIGIKPLPKIGRHGKEEETKLNPEE